MRRNINRRLTDELGNLSDTDEDNKIDKEKDLNKEIVSKNSPDEEDKKKSASFIPVKQEQFENSLEEESSSNEDDDISQKSVEE